MELPSNESACDFCENTSLKLGRVIYECDHCGADCCSDCSLGPWEPFGRVYCDPAQEAFPGATCAVAKGMHDAEGK